MTDPAARPPCWVWVSLSWATFGVAVRDGYVVDAAPIARWTVGKPEHQVARYFLARGATCVRLPDHPTTPDTPR